MNALVIYESMWGNTEQVARAIAAGLRHTMTVDVVDVATAPPPPDEGVDLLVVGGPTHAFSMTRPTTRADAITQGAHSKPGASGLREWLDRLPYGHPATLVATFDTRIDKVRHLPGSAAKAAAKVAHRHGFPRAVHAESFYVTDTAGPLVSGELKRAETWGRQLAAQLSHVS